MRKGTVRAMPPNASGVRLIHMLDIIEDHIVFKWYSKIKNRWFYGIASQSEFASYIREAKEEKKYLENKSI